MDWLGLYLLEDLGPGDATTEPLFPAEATGQARIVAREAAIVAGARHAVELFGRLGVRATVKVADGQAAEAGAEVLRLEGSARGLMAGERVALNLMSRMSGIASATQGLMQELAAAKSAAKVAGTRKTTPGFRVYEKEAITLGGGEAHRMGLWDEAMVKDNHREACGGDVAAAVRTLRAAHAGMTITCEVERLEDALAAAQAGADWLLIDNQEAHTGREWASVVRARHPGIRLEASGGIRPGSLASYGWADRISMGWLTQGTKGRDFALEWIT